MMQKATVIAGFPGIGKSYLFSHNSCLPSSYRVIDHDTSAYSHVAGVSNPAFPANYIAALLPLLSMPNTIVLVGVHDVVRDEYLRHGINFTLVYPDRSLKAEYMRRWAERGSPAAFLKKMDQSWDRFTSDCERQQGCKHVKLHQGQYLGNVVRSML